MKFILTYSNRHKREILMRDIQAALTVQQDDFDKHDNLFNCQNGTLDLDTFEFYNHNSEDMLTQVSNCDYNPDANNTMFMNFLDEVMVGDKELVKYLLRIFGYWITSDTSLETAFFNIGKTTRNGKTTCTETFGAMMGSYAKVIPPSALAMTKYDNGSSPNPFLADLQGVRLLLTSEPPKGMRLNEALFKRLTGGDLLTVRGLYEKPYSFLANIDNNYGNKKYDNNRWGTVGGPYYSEVKMATTWIGKLEQSYNKAMLLFPDDPLFPKIQELYQKKMKELDRL